MYICPLDPFYFTYIKKQKKKIIKKRNPKEITPNGLLRVTHYLYLSTPNKLSHFSSLRMALNYLSIVCTKSLTHS